MPSPFPGMDPFLEGPGLWPDVHHWLISVSAELLNQQLRPSYYARIETRVYVSDESDPGRRVIIPDVRLVHRRGARQPHHPVTSAGRGAAVAEPLEVTTLLEEEIHEARIDVIDRSEKSVVAVIEFVSPSNKVAGSRGRESYQAKRDEVMRSPSHFIEIDLLRDGDRFAPFEPLPEHEYRIHVSRAQRRPRGLVWPIRLDQQLPPVPIPLREKDPDAQLELSEVIKIAYERAAYDLEIDYGQNPNPPLTGEWEQWATSILKEKGLR